MNVTKQDLDAVVAVQGGDTERYRELVERHERRVFGVAWSRLGDASLAEEVVQEAFIRAYERLNLLRDGAKFAGWISRIARNMAINLGRKHRRELDKRKRWELERVDPAPSAEDAPGLCTPETLRQTLSELPAPHRECLVLFYLEGKSGAEAAKAMGISETALRVRLHRARAALRGQLEDKLAGSLEQMRPAKGLVAAIMAGVLATPSAEAAAAGGAAAVGAGGKSLLGFGTSHLLQALGSLPALLYVWGVLWLENRNFQETDGFRAKLHKRFGRDYLVTLVVFVLLFILLKNFLSPKMFLLLAGVGGGGVFMLGSLHQLWVGPNPFKRSMLVLAVSLFLFIVVFLTRQMGWLPFEPGFTELFISLLLFQLLPLALLNMTARHRPARHDYNLFLRAYQGVLRETSGDTNEPVVSCEPHNADALIGFSRFLGANYLLIHRRREGNGLRLLFPPVQPRPWPGWSQLFFHFPQKKYSSVLMDGDGVVLATCSGPDETELAALDAAGTASTDELEIRVADAMSAAWSAFRAGETDRARQLLGEVSESEVFKQSPSRSRGVRCQWALLLFALILCIFGIWMSLSFFAESKADKRLERHRIERAEALAARHLAKLEAAEKKLEAAEGKLDRFYALTDLATACVDTDRLQEAERYAEELLNLAREFRDNWNYGNAIHEGHNTMGRVLLGRGDIEGAKKRLLAAGKTPGSSSLNSFGPDMSLAQELLEHGEVAIVLQYFELCTKFWKLGEERLNTWSTRVKEGKKPDFSGNLRIGRSTALSQT